MLNIPPASLGGILIFQVSFFYLLGCLLWLRRLLHFSFLSGDPAPNAVQLDLELSSDCSTFLIDEDRYTLAPSSGRVRILLSWASQVNLIRYLFKGLSATESEVGGVEIDNSV